MWCGDWALSVDADADDLASEAFQQIDVRIVDLDTGAFVPAEQIDPATYDQRMAAADAALSEEAEAEAAINAAERTRPVRSPLATVWEAFGLVFLAELGDRTQFATVFLAATPAFGFTGLLAGTLTGHALVTALAVGAGQWIGSRVDERLLYRLSGGLFLVFALASLGQAMG